MINISLLLATPCKKQTLDFQNKGNLFHFSRILFPYDFLLTAKQQLKNDTLINISLLLAIPSKKQILDFQNEGNIFQLIYSTQNLGNYTLFYHGFFIFYRLLVLSLYFSSSPLLIHLSYFALNLIYQYNFLNLPLLLNILPPFYHSTFSLSSRRKGIKLQSQKEQR